jgi:hypothetical protein
MPPKNSPKPRKPAEKPAGDQTDAIERNVVAFAEQVGFLIGTVQARTEGWLDRERLSHVVGQIRDHSAQLLKQVKAMGPSKPSQSKSPSAAKRGRGPVDAPGKRHRKPPPQETITRRMGKPEIERLNAKGMKTGRFRKRG